MGKNLEELLVDVYDQEHLVTPAEKHPEAVNKIVRTALEIPSNIVLSID